jgi:predicted PolB exonuclease-like 3'-5' exonuclease
MKYLNELRFENIEQILWLDLESATIEENITEESPYWSAWEQKVKWDEKVVSIDDIKQRYREKAPIYKEFSKVVSVSYGRVSSGILKVKKVTGDEKHIIEQLFKDVETFVAGGVKFLGVFSGKQFDVPFISYRAIVNDIPTISSFDIGGIAPWNIKHLIDVQDILRGSSSTSLSLEGVCASFNMPSPKEGDVTGKSVNSMFWAGEINKIAEYNAKDVLATCNAFCKYIRIPFVEMVIVGEDKIEEKPILEQLFETKQFSKEVKDYLVKLKPQTEKDKNNLIKIILANYQAKGDKVGIKKIKEKEVTDFINSI